MNGRDEEPTRPRLEAGAELDRQVALAHRQCEVLLAATREDPGSATTEAAVAALQLTLDDLEAAAAELRAGNAELAATTRALEAEVADRDNVIEWQSTLLGAVAHDLRTPLSVITGTIETLVEPGRDLHADDARELLAAAHAQSTELRSVLRSLLELSRFQLQSARTDRQTVRVRSLVTSTLAPVDTNGHELEVDVAPAVVAHIDPDQVARVLVNLVGNAVEHTPAGTTVRITANPAPDDPTALLLTVADDGPGVDDDQKDLVFEPFVHLDEQGSSGLGLAIVRMFASFHGGNAWVEDREGGGAAFHVLLPHAFPAHDGTGPGD